MNGLTEGRVVHFVMEPRYEGATPEHRPAMVVRVWNKETGYVNLLVYTDGTNDYRSADYDSKPDFVRWVTSVSYSEGKEPRTWHWIEPA